METGQSALRSTASVLLIFTQYCFFVVGALLVINQGLGLGDFIGQLLLLGRLTVPMNTLLEFGNALAKSRAALHRVEATLAESREDSDHPSESTTLPDHDLSITLTNLHFRFDPGLPLVDGWSLTIKPGETIAIVGPSGSGKTTLFHLILRYMQPTDGSVAIAGTDVRDLNLQSLRRTYWRRLSRTIII